ncbi:MAG: hypothetical protein ABI646_02980 [Acidobacteriota bacterium]
MNNLTARPFSRQTLNAAGSNYLNEFILPDVRARLDEEPVGDADSGFDPSTIDPGTSSDQEQQSEPSAETQNQETQQPNPAENEDGYPAGVRLDTLKYVWAKKAFGDAVKANPTNTGVIVLYADDRYFDSERLTRFVEEGRDRIAEISAIPGDRIQVVFGGYRAVPQVELWVVPQGGPMPEFRTDDRAKPAELED